MAQIFNRSANTLARASILGIVLLLSAVAAALMQLQRSPYVTNQHIAPEQPIPFSHQHHVSGLGIDCRYCHTSVEESSFAGIPPTKTCMNCHAQMWTNADMLAPVRYSFRTGESIKWVRVHDLPDFVYFNHMEYQQPSPVRAVVVDGTSYTSQFELGKALREKYHLRSTQDITSCSTCHR
jgi:hypothetical protein